MFDNPMMNQLFKDSSSEAPGKTHEEDRKTEL
jgi:hypothetical protein